MTRFIKVQRPSADVLTTAVVNLRAVNPTILKDVQSIYSQFPTQERKPILDAALNAVGDSISEAAYRFIFNNAGIRKVLFDDETELPTLNGDEPADSGVDLSKVNYFDAESFEKYNNKPFSNFGEFVDSVHCSGKGDLFIVNMFHETSMLNRNYKLFAKDNTVTAINIADPRMSKSFEAKVEERKLVFLGVVKK